jgi:hypothetical protein
MKYIDADLLEEVINDHPKVPEERIRKIAKILNKKYFAEEIESRDPLNIYNIIKN